ncbi:uncharacterized protein E5676_scaffold155G00150 [Cucumis melo var. makuwa]|uniref:Uncharacterized protein n=1 Tax=Cucumis melo var. makuwa TaxID=1194695 RepID=A0A5A7T0J4_CUCMM|nr:uncharacterized protein E6C27_scaffold57G00220 [Cucumis melo var. makuwa]TYK02327.1 uncharacterized protein E5676_scaffold155G00150 [Cucumis melo var. makuwa]
MISERYIEETLDDRALDGTLAEGTAVDYNAATLVSSSLLLLMLGSAPPWMSGSDPSPHALQLVPAPSLYEPSSAFTQSIHAPPTLVQSTIVVLVAPPPTRKKHNGKLIPVCEHCKKHWHTKEQRLKLHGRPPRGKKRLSNNKQNTRRAYVSEFASPSQHPRLTTLGVIVHSGLELEEDDWHCLAQ